MSTNAKARDRKKECRPRRVAVALAARIHARDVVYERLVGASLACEDEALEDERVALGGPRYEHAVDRARRCARGNSGVSRCWADGRSG